MFRLAFVAMGLVMLTGCSTKDNGAATTSEPAAIAPILDRADARDQHSYARPLEARVYHVALDLDVDFAAERVAGSATLDIEAAEDAREIVLDSRNLTIRSITAPDGSALDYSVGEGSEELGQPITVELAGHERIVIDYVSAPDSDALQFLSPAQTAGKVHPYLFSQGQSILNRSWIPTQDSPGIRQTWEARIRVPNPLTAVMSAPSAGDPVPDGPDHRIFSFAMDKSVPPYLIAIAVGDIVFRPLGLRTGVWTEPAMLDAAAAELADTERMITASEQLFGPYRWGRYDMIVLPPSFPFGGMENPTLTFLTPTFIAGDKSLTALIAHELAHSWSGNLATNATWADFWLNEGMTVYAEQRIVEAVYGEEAYDQAVSLSLDATDGALAELERRDQVLAVDLAGRHPDDGFTDIPYDKGAAFLRTLEAEVGRERFDAFLRRWFDDHAFEPVTSSMFFEAVAEQLFDGDEAKIASFGLREWIYEPGLPENVARGNPEAFAEVDAAVVEFDGGGDPAALGWADWNTAERLRFLGKIDTDLSDERLAALDRAFGLSATGNNEILFLWLKLAIANRYDPAVDRLTRFLTSQGRRKFVRPLFVALAADEEWGLTIARRIYPRARPLYHPVTFQDLDQMGLDAARTGSESTQS
ncbi:M1 family metallopeptidase [Sphingomicrobium astaxanthinifaciens]|uniref:M1 family metallopeptidase n=1 Tax=Sphingomicrobium astaxanthinifaciens TaxID=1227949 RepID=UPI001FCAB83C|nr:M1 family metallopeptidase [Sphingomicrobium astaxanthinifaciens]MCJ7420980.1 M1 family metallopeptidase [Sphingomicrobium astaxanthinifaciens]